MSNLPLKPLVWKDYGNGTASETRSALHEYDAWQTDNDTGWYVGYFDRRNPTGIKEATGFATIDEAKAWCWNHYNEKMQPYVVPSPTWIDASKQLPMHHQDVIVYRYDGEQSSIEHSLYFDGEVMKGFGNVADGEEFFDDVYYWQPIETKALYEAMLMQLQISEVTK